jgi:LysR family cys regulon transcriptional activator
MKLQQLRYLVEVERRGLNVSAAAEALFTSQPGVSKQIGLLEEELGLTIFERSGKRLTGITPPGRAVLAMAQRMLAEAQNMKRVGEDYAAESSGTLSIATTHTQARYTLPPVIRQFRPAPPGGSACTSSRAVRCRSRTGYSTAAPTWASPPRRSTGTRNC